MVAQLCKTIADYPLANGSMPFWYALRDCIPFAFEGLLIAIFLLLFFGNYYLVKSKTGKAKILIALLASSIVTMVLSMPLALAQLIKFITVIFWAFLAIIAYIIFLVSDNS